MNIITVLWSAQISMDCPPTLTSVLVHVLNSSPTNRAVNEDGTAFVSVMVYSFFIFVNYPNSSLIIVFRVLQRWLQKIPPLCHCMLHHTVTSSNNQLQSVTIVIINRFQLVQARSFQNQTSYLRVRSFIVAYRYILVEYDEILQRSIQKCLCEYVCMIYYMVTYRMNEHMVNN